MDTKARHHAKAHVKMSLITAATNAELRFLRNFSEAEATKIVKEALAEVASQYAI